MATTASWVCTRLLRSRMRSFRSGACNCRNINVVASTLLGDAAVPAAVSGHGRCMSTLLTEREKKFYEEGLIDERGLTVFETLHEMQVRSCKVYEENSLFGTYNHTMGNFEWMTFGGFGRTVEQCRAVLKDLGVTEYSKVGIIANNRWEWATIATACYSLNASVVPMYEAQLPSDWAYIINDSGASVVFCANQDIFSRVQTEVKPSTPLLQATLSLDSSSSSEGGPYSFATIMENAAPDREGSFIKAPNPEDLANLIYTSGTTGKPKGVELTHHNLTSNVKAACRSMVESPKDFVREDDRTLAFLPWAHSYGQTCELWMSMSHGASMGICRGVPFILEDLQLVKPSVLLAVPTIYKKVYDGVKNMMESGSPIQKKLLQNALHFGHEKMDADFGRRAPLGFWEGIKHRVLDALVLSKIRARFGGNLRHGFVAGAATPKEVLEFMDAIGIPICEGYGLTETSPIITLNTPEQRHVGSVGRPIGGVTVYIVDRDGKALTTGEEGEICCVGDNVMRGYYRNPEATNEVITIAPDGKSRMFHTGDLGRMDASGFVTVTGRLKEQYKLENGKYVVPTPIEEAIGMSRFISQVVLCGSNRPYNVALLVPEWKVIRDEFEVGDEVCNDELVHDPRVKDLIDEEIRESCYKMKKFEVPSRWALVSPFTVANNMLTPKMSIRRHKVIQTYEQVISELYEDVVAVSKDANDEVEEETAAVA